MHGGLEKVKDVGGGGGGYEGDGERDGCHL